MVQGITWQSGEDKQSNGGKEVGLEQQQANRARRESNRISWSQQTHRPRSGEEMPEAEPELASGGARARARASERKRVGSWSWVWA